MQLSRKQASLFNIIRSFGKDGYILQGERQKFNAREMQKAGLVKIERLNVIDRSDPDMIKISYEMVAYAPTVERKFIPISDEAIASFMQIAIANREHVPLDNVDVYVGPGGNFAEVVVETYPQH